MARVTHIAPHLTLEDVQQKLDNAGSAWLRLRWLVIYTTLLQPRAAHEIAQQIGVSQPFVAKIVSLYKRFGPLGLETPGPGGRRNAYLSLEEEAAFLAPYIAQATQGTIVTTNALHAALSARVGQAVDKSTIYRLLERHRWRKIIPRAAHPISDPRAQATFKKTSVPLLTPPLPRKSRGMTDKY